MRSPAQVGQPIGNGSGVGKLLSRLGSRRQPILIAAGTAILLINIAILAWTSQHAQSQSKLASHSLQVENKLSELLLSVQTAESEQRGFILTGSKTAFEANYLEAVKEIPARVSEIRSMVAHNPPQQAELDALEPKILDKLEDLAVKVRLLEAGDLAEAVRLLRGDRGRELMSDIRERVARMQAEEEQLLVARSADIERASGNLSFVALLDSLLIFLLGGLALAISLRWTKDLATANTALEEKVEERVAELREANDEIQSFAYIVGHDLRAPLVNIMGFTSELEGLRAIFERLVADAKGDSSGGEQSDPNTSVADFNEAIGFIKEAATKMDRLISAILNVSREGKRELKPENIDMQTLVNGVVSTLSHEAEAVGAEIKVGSLPSIICDRLALEQVFSNLLDNALKFLRPDEPGRIQVSGYAASGRVIYEVRDNGRGIAEADQKRVFELFRRAGAQDRRGEGIGLAHVRALVRRLGGTIRLESELDVGSTFRVILPRTFTNQ
jgi:signal transduction histidine kinase